MGNEKFSMIRSVGLYRHVCRSITPPPSRRAAGFAAGNLVGLWIEEKLAIGLATVRVISRRADVELADALRAYGFGATEFSGQGREGDVEVIYTVVQRRDIARVIAEIDRWDPDAFITVEEPRHIRRGWMQQAPRRRLKRRNSLEGPAGP